MAPVFSFYTFLDYDVAKNIVLIINALICLSYPVNFAIYCGMSRSTIVAIIPMQYHILVSCPGHHCSICSFLHPNAMQHHTLVSGSSVKPSAVFSPPVPLALPTPM